MTAARILPIRSVNRRERERRRQAEAAMREAIKHLVAGINGRVPLHDAIFEADHALRPAVREACKRAIA